jgi:hypothetical protein
MTIKRLHRFYDFVENIFFSYVLGDVCRSRREGQTGEDVRQDIFE